MINKYKLLNREISKRELKLKSNVKKRQTLTIEAKNVKTEISKLKKDLVGLKMKAKKQGVVLEPRPAKAKKKTAKKKTK